MLQLTVMYCETKFGYKRISSSGDTVQSHFDHMSPCCDFDLEDSEPIFQHDTLSYTSPQYQVWYQWVKRFRRYLDKIQTQLIQYTPQRTLGGGWVGGLSYKYYMPDPVHVFKNHTEFELDPTKVYQNIELWIFTAIWWHCDNCITIKHIAYYQGVLVVSSHVKCPIAPVFPMLSLTQPIFIVLTQVTHTQSDKPLQLFQNDPIFHTKEEHFGI